jgi:hypothetical protein
LESLSLVLIENKVVAHNVMPMVIACPMALFQKSRKV